MVPTRLAVIVVIVVIIIVVVGIAFQTSNAQWCQCWIVVVLGRLFFCVEQRHGSRHTR